MKSNDFSSLKSQFKLVLWSIYIYIYSSFSTYSRTFCWTKLTLKEKVNPKMKSCYLWSLGFQGLNMTGELYGAIRAVSLRFQNESRSIWLVFSQTFFAVDLRKCFVGYRTWPDFPSAWRRVVHNWSLIFSGLTFPWKHVTTLETMWVLEADRMNYDGWHLQFSFTSVWVNIAQRVSAHKNTHTCVRAHI